MSDVHDFDELQDELIDEDPDTGADIDVAVDTDESREPEDDTPAKPQIRLVESTPGDIEDTPSVHTSFHVDRPEAFHLVPYGPVHLLASWYGLGPVDFATATGWEQVFNFMEDRLNRFWMGESRDPVTGLPGTVSVAAAAAHLLDTGEDFSRRSPEPITPLVTVPAAEAPESWAPRFDKIPPQVLFELSHHYHRGAQRVGTDEHNWAAGYPWSRSFAALKRHLWSARTGQMIDPETGTPRMLSVLWHSFTLTEFQVVHAEFDDRPVRGRNSTRMSVQRRLQEAPMPGRNR